jgi:uncharacterized C2H2 Zn-finger protein
VIIRQMFRIFFCLLFLALYSTKQKHQFISKSEIQVDACVISVLHYMITLPKVNILWTFEETVFFTKSKMAAEQNTKNFKCEICDYSTPKQTKLLNLNQHIRTVYFKRQDFKCDYCDEAFGRKQHLKKHINSTHKKIKKYWCDMCDYASYHRGNLEKHSNAVHLGKKDYKCDICDKACSQKGNLLMHVNSVHKNITSYNCDVCDYSSYTRQHLETHRCHKCDTCDKAFSEKSALTKHVNYVHKNINRNNCDLCEYSSYTRADLERHSKAVHQCGHLCDICDRAFSEKGYLVRHVNRIHKQLKNYSCELCNYTSYTYQELTKHSIRKHAHQNDDCSADLVKTNILIKEAQKDQMFESLEKNLPETYSDHKHFEESLDTIKIEIKEEEILDTMEIEIKEEFVADPLA